MENSRKAFVFYAITLALTVVVTFLVPWIGEASPVVTMLTPTAATLIMLTLIAPEGGFQRFAVHESPIMEPELARRLRLRTRSHPRSRGAA